MNQKHMIRVQCVLNSFFSPLSHQPFPVYDNILALTNRSAPAAQREPIEGQDNHHDASVHHISHSENKEMPHGQSDQTDDVLYSVVNFNRTKTASE